jgi:hypothetical protein
MLKSVIRHSKHERGAFAPVGVFALWLAAGVAAGCSYDGSRLSPPSVPPADAAGASEVLDEDGASDHASTGGADHDGEGSGDTRDRDTGSPADADVPAATDVARGPEAPAGEVGRGTEAGPGWLDGGEAGGADGGSDDLADAPGRDDGSDGEDASDSGIGVVSADADQVDATGDAAEALDGAATAETGGPDSDALPGDEDASDVDLAGDADDAGAPPLDPDLVLWYRFDESTGSIAHDSAQFGGVARDATLATSGTGAIATFSTTSQVGTHALVLAPATGYSNGGGYLVIPALNTLAPQAVTFAVWVRLASVSSSQNWERIFDFGNSTTAPNWLNLAARNGSSPYGPIFNMSNTGHATADQQRLIGATALAASTWHHLVVVLPAGATFTGVMYLDGVVTATNEAMTVHLSDIGATTNNWIGRSQFTSDPYFSGSLDDFRVYRRALSQQEIVALLSVR